MRHNCTNSNVLKLWHLRTIVITKLEHIRTIIFKLGHIRITILKLRHTRSNTAITGNSNVGFRSETFWKINNVF